MKHALLVVVTLLTSSNRILDSSVALDQFQFLIFRLYRSFPACLFDLKTLIPYSCSRNFGNRRRKHYYSKANNLVETICPRIENRTTILKLSLLFLDVLRKYQTNFSKQTFLRIISRKPRKICIRIKKSFE